MAKRTKPTKKTVKKKPTKVPKTKATKVAKKAPKQVVKKRTKVTVGKTAAPKRVSEAEQLKRRKTDSQVIRGEAAKQPSRPTPVVQGSVPASLEAPDSIKRGANSVVSANAKSAITLSDRLRKSREPNTDTAPHIVVEARAGTGKTTTLIEGLKRVKGIPSSLVPSPQQAAVWDSMELSRDKAKTICFVAFNRSIAKELKQRVPEGCEAMTMHSMGLKALTKHFASFGRVDVNQYRVQDLISEITGWDIRDLRRSKPDLLKGTEELVGLCKMNLVGFDGPTLARQRYNNGFNWTDALTDLADYYGIELNGSQQEVFNLVPRILERCKDVSRDNRIDYNDMIWMPVVLDLPVFRYDLLLVDESQDLSKVQQELAFKAGKRIVACGDPKQSVYGFAGADAASMERFEKRLSQTERGCVHLPLTVTRRCGKAIVAEAKKIVPDFDAFPTNPEGKVSQANFRPGEQRCTAEPPCSSRTDYLCPTCEANKTYHEAVQDGDMILCRCNAPLVSECFRFLKLGRKAQIQGRDVGQGLISTIKKVLKVKEVEQLASRPVAELVGALSDWLHREVGKENAKRIPNDNKIINLQDRHDCLVCFCDEATTAADVVQKINQIFTDDKTTLGIKLSSIHRAKGLESQRVHFLMPKEAPCPHPMAKQAWEKQQESHLRYVGITRAVLELVYVS